MRDFTTMLTDEQRGHLHDVLSLGVIEPDGLDEIFQPVDTEIEHLLRCLDNLNSGTVALLTLTSVA